MNIYTQSFLSTQRTQFEQICEISKKDIVETDTAKAQQKM